MQRHVRAPHSTGLHRIVLVVAVVLVSGAADAQTLLPSRAESPLALLRADDGTVGCIVSRLPMTSLVGDPPDMVDRDRLVVEVSAPGIPAAVPHDFFKMPIEVYVLPPGYDSVVTAGKPRRVEAQVVDATLIRSVGEIAFARVTFPRVMLRPGARIVAERKARAANGDEILSQTRCRVRDEDAAAWR